MFDLPKSLPLLLLHHHPDHVENVVVPTIPVTALRGLNFVLGTKYFRIW